MRLYQTFLIMDTLKVNLVQQDIVWENVPENLEKISVLLSDINPGDTDLIVLPEMFTTGFTMNSDKLAVEMDSAPVQWMFDCAAEKNACLMGSLIIKEMDNFFNRLFFIRPTGEFETYDKRHLFRMSGEHEYFTPGAKSLIVEIGPWRIKPLICYDLRFPVWSRNREDYDVLIYLANWPKVRRKVWTTLLAARALENQAYVLGINRVGEDGMGISYSGDSLALNFYGEKMNQNSSESEWTETIELNYQALIDFKQKFPAWRDADNFDIRL